MRRAVAALAVVLCACSAAAADPENVTAAPPASPSFVIPDSDGYGFADCLADHDGACGQVVADAWCEAHGFARAVSFGRVDRSEITGSVPQPAGADGQGGLLMVTCGE